jgi:hypothetical protein
MSSDQPGQGSAGRPDGGTEIDPATDNDIRGGFNELAARAANPAVAARATMPGHSQSGSGAGGRGRTGLRYVPSLVAAGALTLLIGGAVFALGGDDDQPLDTGPAQVDTDGDNSDDADSDSDADPDSDSNPDSNTGDDSDADPNSDPNPGGDSNSDTGSDSDSADDQTGDGASDRGARYRVATELVAADSADPYLNMRQSPGADADLLAKLPATYTGLQATGRAVDVDDGGRWVEFELLDLVQIVDDDALNGQAAVGWVNATFVEQLDDGLPIGTDELPPCSGDGWLPDSSTSNAADFYVYGVESAVIGNGCLRIVVTFGQGQAPIGGWGFLDVEVGPAAAIPQAMVTSSGDFGNQVDLAGTSWVAPTATEADNAVYVTRAADGSLDLVSLLPARGVSVTGFPERGIVVFDTEVSQSGPSAGRAPIGANGVQLLREPLPSDGGVDLLGIARPFESTLGVEVFDADGDRVEAVFSGSTFLGTTRSSEYGVMTDDWLEAWGRFAVRVDGLAAGDYTIELNPDGGSDSPRVLSVPITVDRADANPPPTPTDPEQAAALGLWSFADRGSIDGVPVADEVTLLLGAGGEQQVRSRAELADPDAWTFDAEDAFGWVGPFNPIEVVGRAAGVHISSGPIGHCAGPPLEWPDTVDGLRQVNLEPVGIDSCLDWFGVSLFLNDADEIAAVALDLWEP